MWWKSLNLAFICILCGTQDVDAFTTRTASTTKHLTSRIVKQKHNDVVSGNSRMMDISRGWMMMNDNNDNNEMMTVEWNTNNAKTRRSVLKNALATMLVGGGIISSSDVSNAAVGSLPEFSDTNAVLQGITINVADPSQQNSMIDFLKDGFQFKILRRRQIGSITDTWMGFGPEQLNIPSDFEIPVSSFAKYGGHASIHIRYDSSSTNVYYNKGDNAPGDNIAYLQVAVPEYRISQMTQTGGNIIDAFGFVNVISPSGLPMRGIVGISPDPIMFVAINCIDMKQSKAFYQQLGFVEQEYPYSRPSKGTGQFEPLQPKNSVYLAPSSNSMGVLLLQAEKKKKSIKPNPSLRSLNIIYSPSSSSSSSDDADFELIDPSFVPYSFGKVTDFEKEEQSTRIPTE